MSDTSSMDALLNTVVRLLDQRPDLRARVALVELSQANGASLSLPVDATSGYAPAASMLAGGVVRPEFNLAGHALIAYLAERYLEQNDHDVWQALQTVKGGDPLGRGDIGTFATWPDLLKHPRSGAK